MKIIARTLIILVAALVVVGIFGALNSAGAFSTLGPQGRGGFDGGRAFGRDFNGQPPTLPEGTRPNFERGGFGRGGGDRGGINAFGLSEVIRSLVMMTVVIVIIVLASKVLKRLRSGRAPRLV